MFSFIFLRGDFQAKNAGIFSIPKTSSKLFIWETFLEVETPPPFIVVVVVLLLVS